MTNYIHGQSAQAKLANLHVENRDLRAALTAALNDCNVWRDRYYATQDNIAPIAPSKHGRPIGYRSGCRCGLCTAAESEANRRSYEKRQRKQS